MFSNMMTIMLYLCFMQLCLIAESQYPEEDKIIALPGQPKVSFQQYAGYITVDDKTNRSFFYYFVEAEEDPQLKPLMLWTGGGLGCGVVGRSAFGGHGPFRVNGGQLFSNNHSFNKLVNMLYLDSPAGAGFSYSPDGSLNASLSDEIIARDELVFLQRWLEKFTVFKNRVLYLGGQSYAGHIVPGLAELIVKSALEKNEMKVDLNLKGIMLVGPMLDSSSDSAAIPMYLWAHGVISDYSYELLTNKPACNFTKYLDEYRMEISAGDKTGKRSPECALVHNELNFEYQSYEQKGLFDSYNVKGDVCNREISNDLTLNEPELSHCGVDLALSYLLRDDVQKVLHVRVPQVPCNREIMGNYSKASLNKSMMPTLNFLIRSDIDIMIVSGDQDGRVPHTSTKRIVNKLAKETKLQLDIQYTMWYRESNEYQIGGWLQMYQSHRLTYATIKGGDQCVQGEHTRDVLLLFKGYVYGHHLVEPSAYVDLRMDLYK